MKRQRTDEEIRNEVDYALDHFDELYAKQSAARKATVTDPANAKLLEDLRQKRKIAEQLCAIRKASKLTQSKLAERMNVSQSYVAQLEIGKRFSYSAIKKFAEACGRRVEITIC